jgi:putative transposase
VVVTPSEWQRLTRYARRVGAAIAHLVSIVRPNTMYRWLIGMKWKSPQKPRKPGRPRTPEHIEQVVLRVARETGRAYTRILGELRKLGFMAVSRSTVVNILKRAGLDPSPHRLKATWDEFIKRHASTLWACDFLPRRVLTWRGWKDAYVLVFINVKTRVAWVSPSTFVPVQDWTVPQVERFIAQFKDIPQRPKIVLHDNDTRFGTSFKQALRTHDVEPLPLQIRSPNLNAYVERFIQTLQQECLDHFLVFGTRHLDHLLKEFLEHYHTERPHQGMDNAPLRREAPPSCASTSPVICRHRLGGLLRHYERKAA